jgi:hypothetical protein
MSKHEHAVAGSSQIARLAYDEETSELTTDFRGTVYVYEGVPMSTYDRLVAIDKAGESVGSAHAKLVKRVGYKFRKLD